MDSIQTETVRTLAFAALLLPLAAFAQDSPYCRKVRARASVEAVRLMSPQVVVQGMRFPGSAAGSAGGELESAAASAVQARAGLAFSVADLFKGLQLTEASEADCERYEAQSALRAFVETASDASRLPALRGEVAYLEAHAETWKALLRKEEGRFASRVITLFELNQIRLRAAALDKRLVQARGEAERLAANVHDWPPGPPTALFQSWLARSLAFEQQGARARTLSFWNLRFSTGVVASDRPADWYGLAEVSVHLGALLQGEHERRYLEARTDELRHDRAELESRLFELVRHLGMKREQARRELELVEAQQASLLATREALERAESADVAHAIALLTFDQLVAEADRTHLAALIAELSSLLMEDPHG